MAKGMDTGSIVKYAAIAGGAYWLYQKISGGEFTLPAFLGGPAAAPAPAPTPAPAASPTPATNPPPTTPAASAPPGTTAGPSLLEQLKAAAATDAFFQQQGGKGNADQWNYYRNILRPPGLTAAQFGSAFPGMTDSDRGPMMTAEEFLAKLSGAGLAGLGRVYIPVPIRIDRPGSKPTIVWLRARGAR